MRRAATRGRRPTSATAIRAELEALIVHARDLAERSRALPLDGSDLGSALGLFELAADGAEDKLRRRPVPRTWEGS